LLQSGVEDVIYARAVSRIRSFYSAIEPSRADYFAETSVDQVGLAAMGLFNVAAALPLEPSGRDPGRQTAGPKP
jgi:hypothetical protein